MKLEHRVHHVGLPGYLNPGRNKSRVTGLSTRSILSSSSRTCAEIQSTFRWSGTMSICMSPAVSELRPSHKSHVQSECGRVKNVVFKGSLRIQRHVFGEAIRFTCNVAWKPFAEPDLLRMDCNWARRSVSGFSVSGGGDFLRWDTTSNVE